MLQLVYVSTSREAITQVSLCAILEASRRNNAQVGITGLLVAGGRRFLQALEGPDKAVLDTYARISNDPRHFALVLLTSRTIARPHFGAWSMAFQAGDVPLEESNLVQTVEALTGRLEDKNLRAQFSGFATLHTRAA